MGDERSPHDAGVETTPVDPRGTRGPLLVLLVMAMALAGAIGIAQLLPADVSRPSLPTPGLAVASPFPSAGVPPSVAMIPPRHSRMDLATLVVDGELEDRLVFVDGEVRASTARCSYFAPVDANCVELSIPGLGLPVILGESVRMWYGDPPAGAWLVTVARDGGLEYLGSLLPDDNIPDDPSELTRRLLDAEPSSLSGTLFQVTAWLVADPDPVCSRGGRDASTPCAARPPFLAADEPRPDGLLRSGRGEEVVIEQPVIDVDPGAIVTPGTFLLAAPDACSPSAAWATCLRDQSWVVVARYQPSRSARVLVP